jgi:hypothetical protein
VNWSRRDFVKGIAGLAGWPGLSTFLAGGNVVPAEAANPEKKVPLIYSTDLFHPPDDPDDDVDLATLFAIPELDVRALVLDLGQQQRAKPGSIPVQQMMALTGKKVPFATGLAHPLSYPEDKGLSQFKFFQGGVELILGALREAEEKVMVIATGSARDVMAAFNRDEALFRSKVARIYFNDGNSGGGELQWNPGLDPQAYLRLMTADLPVYWCPAFGGSATLDVLAAEKLSTLQHQVYWKFRQSEIYGALPTPLQNFFLYALGNKYPTVDDPIAYLQREPETELRDRIWAETRNMWSTVSLYHAAGRELYRQGDEWAALAAPAAGYTRSPIYEFVPATVTIDRDLRTTLKLDRVTGQFRVFYLLDLVNYERAMLTSLRKLLVEMPLVLNAGKGGGI